MLISQLTSTSGFGELHFGEKLLTAVGATKEGGHSFCMTGQIGKGSRLFSALYLRGGFTGKKFLFALIATIAFSYIRTEFGASRSRRVGVRTAIN